MVGGMGGGSDGGVLAGAKSAGRGGGKLAANGSTSRRGGMAGGIDGGIDGGKGGGTAGADGSSPNGLEKRLLGLGGVVGDGVLNPSPKGLLTLPFETEDAFPTAPRKDGTGGAVDEFAGAEPNGFLSVTEDEDG